MSQAIGLILQLTNVILAPTAVCTGSYSALPRPCQWPWAEDLSHPRVTVTVTKVETPLPSGSFPGRPGFFTTHTRCFNFQHQNLASERWKLTFCTRPASQIRRPVSDTVGPTRTRTKCRLQLELKLQLSGLRLPPGQMHGLQQ